jgi:high affinity Mn2+ porin
MAETLIPARIAANRNGNPAMASGSRRLTTFVMVMLALCACSAASRADDAERPTPAAKDAAGDEEKEPTAETGPPEVRDWSVHVQGTGIYQGTLRFASPYRGPNSLDPGNRWQETISGTAYLGRRLWEGAELYFNPEFNQGFGLSDTRGLAGFPNGEAQKAGFDTPKPNVARLFLRQTFGLGGDQEKVDDDLNSIAGARDVSRVTVTAGKFAAPDIFDDNRYAHDPRTTFLNWSVWEAAAWDYPADQKGYTDGLAVELNQPGWALRGGWFLEPKIANDRNLDPRFWKHFGAVAELELRHEIEEQPGKLRLLAFANRAHMGNLREATDIALATGAPADIALVRRDRVKYGFAVNLEQAISDELGAFGRASWNDGRTEAWAFTDIDTSVSLGASLKGARWRRPQDTVGLAAVMNLISKDHQDFFAAGGTGILVGDGRLSYGPEGILEAYYSFAVVEAVALSLDYQFVVNPAYNSDRGPVNIFAARVHAQF